MCWLYMGTRGCLWQMELDVLAAYGKSWMFMVNGTRYNGCIWELVGVYGRWN